MPDIYLNREMAFKYISNGGLLQSLKEYQNDREIVWAAISHQPTSIIHASDEIQQDRDTALHAVKYGCDINRIHKKFHNDLEIVVAALSYNSHIKLYEYLGHKNDEVFKVTKLARTLKYLLYPELIVNPEFIRRILHLHDVSMIQYHLAQCRILLRTNIPNPILDIIFGLIMQSFMGIIKRIKNVA